MIGGNGQFTSDWLHSNSPASHITQTQQSISSKLNTILIQGATF